MWRSWDAIRSVKMMKFRKRARTCKRRRRSNSSVLSAILKAYDTSSKKPQALPSQPTSTQAAFVSESPPSSPVPPVELPPSLLREIMTEIENIRFRQKMFSSFVSDFQNRLFNFVQLAGELSKSLDAKYFVDADGSAGARSTTLLEFAKSELMFNVFHAHDALQAASSNLKSCVDVAKLHQLMEKMRNPLTTEIVKSFIFEEELVTFFKTENAGIDAEFVKNIVEYNTRDPNFQFPVKIKKKRSNDDVPAWLTKMIELKKDLPQFIPNHLVDTNKQSEEYFNNPYMFHNYNMYKPSYNVHNFLYYFHLLNGHV